MARTPKLDESALTKMEVRKLNALRKSIGNEIGEKAFLEWLRTKPTVARQTTDKTAEVISDAIMGLIERGTIRSIPRRGYVVKRGRGRVVVESAT